jgi:hyperosmotically inducible periplasmic protein
MVSAALPIKTEAGYMKKSVAKVLGGVALAALLTACAGGPNERSTGEVIDDGRILGTAKTALMNDPEIKSSSIDVDVERGAVTLTGVARSQKEKDKIVETVWGVKGVKSVRTDIQIKPPNP